MRTARLGTLGPEISVIGFGAWEAGGAGWGPNPPTTEVLHAFHAAFEAGMNWVDTAETYGYPGRSEGLVGRAVAGRDILVFTKVSPFGAAWTLPGYAAERSVRRLRRDVIDLYQVHWADERIPVERTWEAMHLTSAPQSQIALTVQQVDDDPGPLHELIAAISPAGADPQPVRHQVGYLDAPPASLDAQQMPWLFVTQTLDGTGAPRRGKYKSAYMIGKSPTTSAPSYGRASGNRGSATPRHRSRSTPMDAR